MTAILALFNRDGEPADLEVVQALLAPSRYPYSDGEDVWSAGNVALAHQHFWVTPEEVGERQPLLDPSGQFAITCDARLDNRPELIEALDMTPGEGRALSDAALILRAYQCWGADCVVRLLGDFSFVVWDSVKQQLFLVRDAMGGRGLAYYRDARIFVAATNVEQLLAHPAINPQINDRKVACFLTQTYDDAEETFFESLYYLPPAHAMIVTSDSVRVWRHWDVDPDQRIRYRSDQEYADHFLALFTEAVRCRLRVTGTVGLSLSGGMDSTSIAAVAAPMLGPAQLKTFSYVFDELSSCDERQCIGPVVERLGLDATHIVCDDRWTLRDLPAWPVERDYVISDAYIWLPTAIRQAARAAGCRAVMTGHFGDALLWDDDFWTAAMLHDARLGELFRTLMASRSTWVWRQALTGSGIRSLIPGGLRRAYRRLRPRAPAVWAAMVDPMLLARVGVEPGHGTDDHPRKFPAPGQRAHYATLTGSVLLVGRPIARRFYGRHGLELVEPFYDRRLVSYVMAIPADQWGRPDRSKWILRNAMTGRLPEQIVERKERTTFEALWDLGLCERERSTVEALLANPLVVRRGYVRTAWLQEELHSGQAWTDGGFALWLCLSLELWLRRFW